MHNIALEFNPQDFRRLLVVNESLPTEQGLAEGAVLLRVQRFGLSSNNLASALSPGLESSWPRMFAATQGQGRLPVWGYAEVVASNRAGYEPGMGFYGYFPMSRFVMLHSGQQTAGGCEFDHTFFSGGGSDVSMASVENLSDVDLQILLRPLLSTGFLIAQELMESQFWHTRQIIVTCASSKTAIGLAYFLQDYFLREGLSNAPQIIGLTAENHLGFVRQNTHFDQALSYEQFRLLDPCDSVLVDFSGNYRIRGLLHYFLKDRLIHAYGLGSCHWQAPPTGAQPVPDPEYFSALSFYQQRLQKAERLNQQFQQRWGGACQAFNHWLEPKLVEGVEEVRWVYEQMLAGKARPTTGYLCQL